MAVRFGSLAAVLLTAALAGAAEPADKAKLVQRVYPVADLIIPVDGVPGMSSAECRPAARTLEDNLIKLIGSTIAPASWNVQGGSATADYYPLGMALVITQTADVHEQVAELLAALRRLQEAEVALELRLVRVSEKTWERLTRELGQTSAPSQPDVLWAVALDDRQVATLCDLAQRDAHTSITQTPKLTLFNGQAATMSVTNQEYRLITDRKAPDSAPNEVSATGVQVTAQPILSADGQYLRLKLGVRPPRGAVPGPAEPTLTFAQGGTMLLGGWKVPGNGGKGSVSERFLVLATPRVAVNKEVEVTPPRQEVARPLPRAVEISAFERTTVPAPQPIPVADNVAKWEQAERLCLLAERHLRKGRSRLAREAYEEVRRLCPGTQYDALAAERLQTLRTQDAAGEEQEHNAAAAKNLARLLEAYHQACAEGRLTEATQLAVQALALDPACFSKK